MAQRLRPYGVRAIELDLGIKIQPHQIVDYTGPRLADSCTKDDAQGATPNNPCHCAGAHMAERMMGCDRASIILSRVYGWSHEDQLCYRAVGEGDVRAALDAGESPVGKKLVIKPPKKSLRLGERAKYPPTKNPGSCPQRGNRGQNGRIETVRARERLEKEKRRRRNEKKERAAAAAP